MPYTVIVRNIKTEFRQKQEIAYEKAEAVLKRAKIKGKNPYIYKRSTDSRNKERICFVYSIAFECENLPNVDFSALGISIEKDELEIPDSGTKRQDGRVVVCGFGPAGMFSAMLLAEAGYKPIVIEQGDTVRVRREKVEKFFATGKLDLSSNIQFGAGGAGTFSDGKLITRISDPACRYVFKRLCEFGAPDEIMYDAKPHIGTDKLLCIVEGITEYIKKLGAEVYFNTKLTGIKKENGHISSLKTTSGEIKCSVLIAAIGNSARETYAYLIGEGYFLEKKPISVGVRIEHKREDVDRAMYGRFAGHELLGAAPYNYSKRVNNRGVYTFCMCPGGEVVGATSQQGCVVTNGMSEYKRDKENSNSAVVVEVSPDNPLEYQNELERLAFALGGGEYYAPCQSVGDFLDGRNGRLPNRIKPTYMNGRVRSADLNKLFSSDITQMLKLGITSFDKSQSGFAVRDALLTGAETRTSAPYRIVRREDLCAVGVDNLYPCGEGAGYAGGITSAACDGLRIACEVIKKYEK